MRRAGRTDSTVRKYRTYLDAFGTWLGKRDPALVFTLPELEAWFDHWEAEYSKRNGKPPSQSTRRNHQTALHSFYDFLYRRDYVQANPMDKLAHPERFAKPSY
jgi:site-specific recombinase XerD